jgi:hypothetical protein
MMGEEDKFVKYEGLQGNAPTLGLYLTLKST